jgi:hypothetical protein
MTRRVHTTQLHGTAGGGAPDTYFDKVVKYIPADIVAAWVAVGAVIRSAQAPAGDASGSDAPGTVLWISFFVGVVLTGVWTWKQTNRPGEPTAMKQIAISMLAFVVWVFALGPPFAALDWYQSWYGSLALIGYTLAVGAIDQ